MTNEERLMRDVANVVRDYETERMKGWQAVEKLRDLVQGQCSTCAFNPENCQEDHTKTCSRGFFQWLEEEVGCGTTLL